MFCKYVSTQKVDFFFRALKSAFCPGQGSLIWSATAPIKYCSPLQYLPNKQAPSAHFGKHPSATKRKRITRNVNSTAGAEKS